MIRYQDVGMKYGENTILEHIDLEIDAGEFFVLVGPSGSGKTTLLRMLNQLTLPTQGDIYLNNKKIKEYDKQKLRLNTGYVLQDSSLFPNLTLEDNITIQLEQLGVTKEKRRARALVAANIGLPVSASHYEGKGTGDYWEKEPQKEDFPTREHNAAYEKRKRR